MSTDQRGERAAEALIRAVNEARRLLAELTRENESLRADNARVAAEINELREHSQTIEKISHEYEDRYLEIERQNGNLASLYIATYNLHSTLDFSDLLRLLREIVVNLVGSESFGVYVRSARDDGDLELLAGEGIDLIAQRTVRAEGIVGEAQDSQRVIFAQTHAPGFPLACVPLVLRGEVLGAIVIYGLLAHKTQFESTDVELLELLASQAATALYAARLHAKSGPQGTVRELFVLPEYALAIATGERNA